MVTKSLLRYPGGKTKAIKYIRPFWQKIPHSEYREPFVGGGSIAIAKPKVKFNWINDMDKELISFYEIISKPEKREELISDLLSIKIDKALYDELYHSKPQNDYEKAKKFYILNRCSFSGITKWNSFIGCVRYNIENAQNLMREFGNKIQDYKITCMDFSNVIKAKSIEKKVFLILDPPYAESRQQAAYTYDFTDEDHLRLSKILKRTEHPFLLTYDDCAFIRNLYDWAYQYSHTWTYSVANVRNHHNPREAGNELFITNFKYKDDKPALNQLEII